MTEQLCYNSCLHVNSISLFTVREWDHPPLHLDSLTGVSLFIYYVSCGSEYSDKILMYPAKSKRTDIGAGYDTLDDNLSSCERAFTH